MSADASEAGFCSEITLRDRLAAAAFDAPEMHLTGCTGEERLMLATADRILTIPEMQHVRDLLSLLARTENVRDLVLGNLAVVPSLLRWVTE